MSGPFVAQYASTCVDCGEEFPTDTVIRLNILGPVHDRCPEPATRGEVCPRCFTEKSVSGACGCDQ